MNFNGNLLFESKTISNSKEISHESVQRPYTSAPKMVDVSIDYENLTEISLSNTSTNNKYYNNNNNNNNTKFPQNLVDSNLINCENKNRENIYAVDELLKCSNVISDESKVIMPIVEDGLSSESEIGSPLPSFEKCENHFMKDSFMRHITKDIEELRMAINNNESFSNDNVVLDSSLSSDTSTLSNSFSIPNNDGFFSKESLAASQNTNEMKQSIGKSFPTELSNKIESSKKNKETIISNKAVLPVIANEEKDNNFFKFCATSNKVGRKTKISDTKCPKKGDKFNVFCHNKKNIDNEALEAQHWTFPVASHTIYSSSSSDNDDEKNIQNEQALNINNQINITSKNEILFFPKEYKFQTSSEFPVSDQKYCDTENHKSKPTGGTQSRL